MDSQVRCDLRLSEVILHAVTGSFARPATMRQSEHYPLLLPLFLLTILRGRGDCTHRSTTCSAPHPASRLSCVRRWDTEAAASSMRRC